MRKSIPIAKSEYLNLIGFPIVGFFISLIFIVITYFLASTLMVLLCLIPAFYFFIMFIKRIISLKFHILSERISKEDLFSIIDLLVKMKGWEYDNIRNNEVIINQQNTKKKDRIQLTLQYFPDKILINAIHKPIHFYDFSIRNHQSIENFIREAIIQKVENQDILTNWKREKALENQLGKSNYSSANKKNDGLGGLVGLFIIYAFIAFFTPEFLMENLIIILGIPIAILLNIFLGRS